MTAETDDGRCRMADHRGCDLSTKVGTQAMSRERNHHYLPEFHLKRFAIGPRREVGVFDKKWGKFGRAPAATSARVRDYYLVPGATPEQRLAAEREFARLENLVAPLIARLDEAQPGFVPFDDVDRHNLASYAAILHVRGPAYRDNAQKRAQELATDLDALGLANPADFRRAARRQGMKGTNEELEQKRTTMTTLLSTGKIRIDFPFAATLGNVPIAVRRGVPLLVAREWELLRVGWPGFLIGDQPVALLSHDQLVPSIGFGSPDVQIFMPLSPRTLLVMSDRPRRPEPLQVKAEGWTGLREPWWATANKVAWLSSQRYVWGPVGALQATSPLIPGDFLRRDLRVLDEDQEVRRRAIAVARRRERRRQVVALG